MKELEYFMQAKSDKSVHTINLYHSVIIKFLESLKIETIEELEMVSAVKIREYVLSLNVGASSKNSTIRVLKSFYSWLFDNDFITVNQMNKIKKQAEGKRIVKMPTTEEMKIIMDNCDNNVTHLQIGLMARVGLRREEVTNIQLVDISNDGKLLVRGKGNKQAVLKLPEDIFSEIKKYLGHKNRVQSNFLFSYNGDKVSPTSINLRITEYISSLGFSPDRVKVITPHSFRHRCASNVYEKTHDAYAVMHQLRHSDIVIGQRYIHTNENEMDTLSASL
jgi:integrase/recombinase XerD